MPKPSLKATTETTVVMEVKLAPQARKMLLSRLEEHEQLATQVREIKGTKKKPGRLKRIEEEVSELFRKEKAGKALVAGTKLENHQMKLVIGKTKKFDQMGFMKKHGVTQADFDEFTDYKDNEPYIKFTHGNDDDTD